MTQSTSLIFALTVGLAVAVLFFSFILRKPLARQNQAERTRKAVEQENADLANVETAERALASIRQRHDAAYLALRALPNGVGPEEAARTLRLHLPGTSFEALITPLTQHWDRARHPAYLAALTGVALEHADRQLLAIGDFRESFITVFENAPADLLRQVSAQLSKRVDKLDLWILSGGIDDARRAASLRRDDRDVSAALTDVLKSFDARATVVAQDFIAWIVERCEADSDEDAPRELASRIAFDCRPLMGRPLKTAQAAFERHRDNPDWRAAALTLDALVISAYASGSYAYEGALDDFDFASTRGRLREGLVDENFAVAGAAGHATADIIEAGHLRDNQSIALLREGLEQSASIHRLRPPGQTRLDELLRGLEAPPAV